MFLFHRLRNAVNRILSPAGFAVERVARQPWFRPENVTVPVGRYSILIPTINPLAQMYQINPDYSAHLATAAALLKKKYPDFTALDIGANVGDTACIIKSGADVPVVCIEGDDLSFDLLERNLRQLTGATAHKLFLGEKTETKNISTEKTGWNTTLIPDETGASRQINIVRLDDFLPTLPAAPVIKLLKIDTEGFDCAILRGSKKLIQEAKPVISFEYNRDNMAALGEKGLDTLAMLADLGYATIAFHDCGGRFFDAVPLADEKFVRNIHDYADGRHAAIYYFDLTLFHQDDLDVAQAFAEAERARRTK